MILVKQKLSLKLWQTILTFFLFVGFAIAIFYFRSVLDRDGIYVTGDGQIKLYQAFALGKSEDRNSECLYRGKPQDPDYHFFPIQYPWAIFRIESPKCVWEYPPFFPWLVSRILSFLELGMGSAMRVPLIFYLCSAFLTGVLFYRTSQNFGLSIALFFSFFFSFPLLTVLDFSENSIFLLCLLGSLILFVLESNPYRFLGMGFLWGIAYAFRFEALFLGGVFGVFLLWENRKEGLMFGLGFLFPFLCLSLFHYMDSGHFLGHRFVSSVLENQNAKSHYLQRLSLLKAYLLGDSLMVGLLPFQPLYGFVLVSFFLFRKSFTSVSRTLVFSGLVCLVIIPLLVTFYAGVGYFGLRYLEIPCLLLLLGFCTLVPQKNISSWVVLFVFLGTFYFNYHSTKEGLKVLYRSSREISELQSFIEKSPEKVIHTSLYSSIWIGRSFWERSHFQIQEEAGFQKIVSKPGEQFVLIKSPKDVFISPDIPKRLFPHYINDWFPASVKVLEHRHFLNVDLYFLERLQ